MRLAAVADVHFRPEDQEQNIRAFSAVNEVADLLVLAGDLTNHGRLEEMEACLEVLSHVNLPMVAVLGNHDHESGQQDILAGRARVAGIHVLDGTCFEHDGVGFAGTKGFVGGFGRGVLTAFGEPEIKTFVRASIDEALKLERAMSQLRTQKRVIVLHYSPIAATIQGEAQEIFPFLGTSRLAEVVDRHGADLVVHGHAHNGCCDGKTPGGVPVHNVAITLLQRRNPSAVYRIFDV